MNDAAYGLLRPVRPALTTLRAMPPQGQKNQHVFQAPKGTKDLYPQDLAKRRYVTNAWRDAAIAHGFDEINGPTFEHLDLYTVKSGEGIVSELFSFRRAKGDTDYALRPEFTPTLARMYAAKANSLPKPTKWFSIGPYFRAERPQRGRLREFLQWNVDVIGDDSVRADAEVIACCVDMLKAVRLTPETVKIKISDRRLVSSMLIEEGVDENDLDRALALLDRKDRISIGEFSTRASELHLDFDDFLEQAKIGEDMIKAGLPWMKSGSSDGTDTVEVKYEYKPLLSLLDQLKVLGVSDWIEVDLSIVRGLAYYTGTVFEVIADGERAVAGGGRYDGLIELFGGPPTPAVGFAIGDVVLSLLLKEKGLIPDGAALADKLSATPVSNRPDAFVITEHSELDSVVTQTIMKLRRHRLHARGTYKSTRKIGKLLKEASSQDARIAVIIRDPNTCTIEVRDEGWQDNDVALSDLPLRLRELKMEAERRRALHHGIHPNDPRA